MHPNLYGQPTDKGISSLHFPEERKWRLWLRTNELQGKYLSPIRTRKKIELQSRPEPLLWSISIIWLYRVISLCLILNEALSKSVMEAAGSDVTVV